jgi:lamin tail-like protein/type IX secretion system substrate protein
MKTFAKKFMMVLTALLMLTGVAMGDVFMTELADPNNNADARFIELYNNGVSSVDFTEGSGWKINKYTNGSATVSTTLNLTGTITAGGFYVIAYNVLAGTFASVYGQSADQLDAVSNGVAGSNGDDTIELVNGSGTVVDFYGVQPHADLSSSVWEYEDGRAERANGATTGKNPPVDADWNTWSDGSGGDVVETQDAPGDFDPGAWIGAAASPTITLSTTSLSNFSYVLGNGPSAEQSFTAEGSDLTADISLVPPTNYEISTGTGGSFSATNPITLTHTAGTVASTTIYVRLKAGLSVGTYSSENISATSSGATGKSVACSGMVAKAEPSNHVTSFSATSDHASVSFTWTDNDGAVVADGYMIKASTTSLVAITVPVDGTDEADDEDLSDGSGVVSAAHGDESFNWTGLDAETTYYFKIYPFTNSGTLINYKTDGTVPSATQATTAAPDEPTVGELIITEVVGDDVDATNDDDGFMEIYNNSSKTLNLSNMQARYYNSNPGTPSTTYNLSGAIAAGEYIVITQNNTNFTAQYSFSADFEAGGNFYFNGGDDGVDINHTTNGVLDQFNDNGALGTPWTWDDANVYERTSPSDGAVETNWTAVTTGTGTPGTVNDYPLPITLASFTATAVNGAVELAWETATETNNANFVIYRNDVAIASVAGAGTTTEPHSYSYVDDAVVPGVTYTYVLADVDYANEETKYTDDAVTVEVEGGALSVEDFVVGAAYPNPFNPTAVVPIELSRDAMVKASLYDLNGREIKALVNANFTVGTHDLRIDGAGLTTGLYLLQVVVDNVVDVQKIALMK